MARFRVARQGLVIVALGIAAVAAVPAPGMAGVAAAGTGRAAASASWHASVRIRLPADAGTDPNASLSQIACFARSCLAGGSYLDKSRRQYAIIARESGGKWARAVRLRLPPGASADPNAAVEAVACPTGSYCIAVGFYFQGFFQHGFIAVESRGKWARAFQPRLPVRHSAGQETDVIGARCHGQGSCVAVGTYSDRSGHGQAMIVTESRGRWGRAAAVSLPKNAAANPVADLQDVGCPPGTCVAVGSYRTRTGSTQAMAVVESKGKWKRATQARLPANAMNGEAFLAHVTCSAATSCLAVGAYTTTSGGQAGMADTLAKGSWRRAIRVAGPAHATAAVLLGVSCRGTACLAVGSYQDSAHATRALAVLSSRGKWGAARQVKPPAGAAAGSMTLAQLLGVACTRSGTCTAVGAYNDGSHHSRAMAAVRS